MKGMSKAATLLIAVSVTFGCAASLHSDIPLVWKPTNDIYSSGAATLTGMYTERFRVLPFADSRENRKEIARNVEGSEARTVTTRDDVAAWCTGRFKEILKQYGLTVAESDWSITLKGEILNFYVTEDNLYKSSVGIKVTAEDPGGKVLWQGVLTGTAKRFGRSYQLENYYEALSDAYLEAVSVLLKNEDFRKSLKRTAS